MEGKGDLILTGQLGDVMQESARAAISYARRAHRLITASTPGFFDKHNIHVHVPAGAIPEGWSVGRDHDGDRAHLGPDRASGAQGRGDDRRDHAARQGAADRRVCARRRWRRTVAASRPSCCRSATPRIWPNCRCRQERYGVDPGQHARRSSGCRPVTPDSRSCWTARRITIGRPQAADRTKNEITKSSRSNDTGSGAFRCGRLSAAGSVTGPVSPVVWRKPC